MAHISNWYQPWKKKSVQSIPGRDAELLDVQWHHTQSEAISLCFRSDNLNGNKTHDRYMICWLSHDEVLKIWAAAQAYLENKRQNDEEYKKWMQEKIERWEIPF